MQQSDKNKYLARFKVSPDNIYHIVEDINLADKQINKDGTNLSAIELTDIKFAKEGLKMPEIPELKAFDTNEFAEDV